MDLEHKRRGEMYSINGLQLIGIIIMSAFLGSMAGFFLAAMLTVSGRCSDEEERREWPGPVER